jgi:hypothetical protein
VKRLLQALALLQLALVVGLGMRVVDVLRTPLPGFSDIPELPAATPLPPPRERTKPSPSVTDAIVDADLFDDARGTGEPDIDVSGIEVDAAPVAPPTTVKLTGVILLGADPVAILSDPNVGPEQKSVRSGEMFGEYEIGDISQQAVILLGASGQEFQVPLRVEAASGGGPAPVGPPGRPTAPGAARPAATVRNTARPATAAAQDQKTMTARERAQAISQRNADIRNRSQGNNAPGEKGENESGAPDPVQARLEALRQLREAAKTR